MKAYRFRNRIAEIQPYEELSSKPNKAGYVTKYLFRSVTNGGMVEVELRDRQRTRLTFHPSDLWDVMVRSA
jgi:hypothetical protein